MTFKVAGDQSLVFTAGKFGYLQEGQDDAVHIFKVASVAYSSPDTTVTIAAGYAIPTGVAFSAAAGRVSLVNKLDADPSLGNKNFSMKMVGIMPEGNKPITLLLPKVKITKGFSMSFSTENYGNLPFEFSPYTPVATDPGYDPDFAQKMHVLK